MRADMQQLRPYQVEAVERILLDLDRVRSTLLVCPTGTGKTQIFSEVARRWRPRGRVLVLAHRDELIEQAKTRMEQFGLQVKIEKADLCAARDLAGTDVVVASVQTLAHESRRLAYNPSTFGLLIVDEAHHAPAPSYRNIIGYFSGARVLGVTATPDRGDEIALGNIFESVAFEYDLRDAIDEGWLVPIRQKAVTVQGLDLSHVRTTAGDLNDGDLDRVLTEEQTLHGMVGPTVELAGHRPTLIFAAIHPKPSWRYTIRLELASCISPKRAISSLRQLSSM